MRVCVSNQSAFLSLSLLIVCLLFPFAIDRPCLEHYPLRAELLTTKKTTNGIHSIEISLRGRPMASIIQPSAHRCVDDQWRHLLSLTRLHPHRSRNGIRRETHAHKPRNIREIHVLQNRAFRGDLLQF